MDARLPLESCTRNPLHPDLPPVLAFASRSRPVRFCVAGKKAMAIGVLSRKRKSPDAATEVFTAGPERSREVLRQRFQSELDTVRRLLKKARSEVPPAKRSKRTSPPSVTVINRTKAAKKKMSQGERELVAEDLAGLAAKLPDHIVQFLEKQSCAISGGEMEIDIHALQDEAVVELQQKLDEFVLKRANPSAEERASSKVTAVDICGGVSPLTIAPAALQPAEEEDEDVDICGDASPVVMPKNLSDDAIIGGSPSSSGGSSSDSDSESDSSSESDSDSSSDSGMSDSESDEDQSVDSPAPAEHVTTPPRTKLIARAKESLEKQRKDARCRARETARQEVLETERTAMPTNTIHPMDLESLGIGDQYSRANNLLRQLGLFLKADNYGIQEQHHRRRRRQIFQEELEEGEIRV